MNFQLPRQLNAVFLLFFIFFNLSETHAQSWLWGKRGGGAVQPQYFREMVNKVATDKDGNVYVLANAYSSITVDNHPITSWSSWNLLLSSWDGNGHYRWTKSFGNMDFSLYNMSLTTDTLNGVYVIGSMESYGLWGPHLDTDTTPAPSYKTNFLIKYDTGGTFQWLRFPQSDTISGFSQNNTAIVAADMDPRGNSYLLSLLAPGSYANGAFVAAQAGIYMLQYDASGNFVSGMPMPIGFSVKDAFRHVYMKRCDKDGSFYIGGRQDPMFSHDTLYFGATTVDQYSFLTRFDKHGNLRWVKQSVGNNLGIMGQFDVDDNANVYLCGVGHSGNQFNGFAMVSPNSAPFALVIDSNGNNVWGMNGQCNIQTYPEGIVLNRSTGEAVMFGEYSGSLSWSGYNKTLNHAPGNSDDIYVVRFNAQTGGVNAMDSVASISGANEYLYAAAVDKQGNVYMGGEFTSNMYFAGDTIENTGGYSDWFVAKYGHVQVSSSVNNINALVNVKVYPNPVQDQLTIESPVSYHAAIVTIDGRVLTEQEITAPRTLINIRNLPSGMYLLQLTDANGQRGVVKIVKQ